MYRAYRAAQQQHAAANKTMEKNDTANAIVETILEQAGVKNLVEQVGIKGENAICQHKLIAWCPVSFSDSHQ